MPRRTTSTRLSRPPKKTDPSGSTARRSPMEEGVDLWTRFAMETGKTATEFLRRFSEEQQKAYSSWIGAFSKPSAAPPVASASEEGRSRQEEWTRRTQEVGDRLREAFQTAMVPQRQAMDLWMRTVFPASRSVKEGTLPAGAPGTTSSRPPIGPGVARRRWIEGRV